MSVRIIAGLLGTLAATAALMRLAAMAGPPVRFDVGPATGGYSRGFTESWEYRPTTARFVGRYASIELPLATSGGEGVLAIRYARLKPSPALVRLAISGRPARAFLARPVQRTLAEWLAGGRRGSPFDEFHLVRLPVSCPPGPLRIELEVEDDDPAGFALAVDWIRLDGIRASLGSSSWGSLVLVGGVFLVCVFAGFGLSAALVVAGALALTAAACAALDPFALAHVASRIALPAVALTGLVALVVRRRPGGRAVVLIFLAGYLLEAGAVFHPSYYYPDVLSHSRYALALARAEGGLIERGRTAQLESRVGCRRDESGTLYAFPYSPLFYVPFARLGSNRALVEDGMKHVAVAAAPAEVLAVFWLAGLLFGRGEGVFAALLAATLPPLHSRLLLAMWPTITGHLLDVLAVGAATVLVTSPESIVRSAGFAVSFCASMLGYIAGLFNLSAFVACLAFLERRRGWRLLALAAIAAGLTLVLLYLPFTRTFFGEIAPTWIHARGSEDASSTVAGLASAFARVPIFFGLGYPAMTVAGLALARGRARPGGFGVLAAWGLAFLILELLRGVSHGLFRDLKEIEFVSPLVALTSGLCLEALAERGRRGRHLAYALAAGLVLFGIGRCGEYLDAGFWRAGLR